MEQFDDFPDDGLTTPEIGIWGIEKYRLISCYAAMFSKTMANKWDCIVYLDLFAGAGRARIKENNKIFLNFLELILQRAAPVCIYHKTLLFFPVFISGNYCIFIRCSE